MISEQWIAKDVEGNGRGVISGTSQEFAWRDWRQPRKICQDTGLQAKLWTRDIPNMK
jgi:hypothetical protein